MALEDAPSKSHPEWPARHDGRPLGALRYVQDATRLFVCTFAHRMTSEMGIGQQTEVAASIRTNLEY